MIQTIHVTIKMSKIPSIFYLILTLSSIWIRKIQAFISLFLSYLAQNVVHFWNPCNSKVLIRVFNQGISLIFVNFMLIYEWPLPPYPNVYHFDCLNTISNMCNNDALWDTDFWVFRENLYIYQWSLSLIYYSSWKDTRMGEGFLEI